MTISAAKTMAMHRPTIAHQIKAGRVKAATASASSAKPQCMRKLFSRLNTVTHAGEGVAEAVEEGAVLHGRELRG